MAQGPRACAIGNTIQPTLALSITGWGPRLSGLVHVQFVTLLLRSLVIPTDTSMAQWYRAYAIGNPTQLTETSYINGLPPMAKWSSACAICNLTPP